MRRTHPPAQARVLVDYTCPHGPQVTHVRGILLVSSMRNLQSLGVYDRYRELLSPVDRQAVCEAIAASWIPIEHVLAHYDACDRLNMSVAQLTELGVLMAGRISETFLGSVLTRTRSAGFEGFTWALSQLGRLHARSYLGGHVQALELGPKDVVTELSGAPYTTSRTFRTAYLSWAKAMAEPFCKTAFVRYEKPSDGNPQTVALSFSWV